MDSQQPRASRKNLLTEEQREFVRTHRVRCREHSYILVKLPYACLTAKIMRARYRNMTAALTSVSGDVKSSAAPACCSDKAVVSHSRPKQISAQAAVHATPAHSLEHRPDPGPDSWTRQGAAICRRQSKKEGSKNSQTQPTSQATQVCTLSR